MLQSLVVLRTWRELGQAQSAPDDTVTSAAGRPVAGGSLRWQRSGRRSNDQARLLQGQVFTMLPDTEKIARRAERDQFQRIRLQRFLPCVDFWISASDDHMKCPLREHPPDTSELKNRDSPKWLGRLDKCYQAG